MNMVGLKTKMASLEAIRLNTNSCYNAIYYNANLDITYARRPRFLAVLL